MPKRLLPFVLALFLLLAGCQTSIYTDLDEEQANAMFGLLLSYGLKVEKKEAGKGLYAISVDDEQVVRALKLLREQSLPRDRFASLGTVFSAGGMISSSSEERARLMWALSQELSNTFSRIDGVLTSRVHVVLGINDPVNNVKIPASATVFLRHRPDSLVTTLVADIRKATAGAVAGLSSDNVMVLLVPVREAVTVPTALPPPPSLLAQHISLPLFLQTIGLALFFTSLALGVLYYIKRKKEKIASTQNTAENGSENG